MICQECVLFRSKRIRSAGLACPLCEPLGHDNHRSCSTALIAALSALPPDRLSLMLGLPLSPEFGQRRSSRSVGRRSREQVETDRDLAIAFMEMGESDDAVLWMLQALECSGQPEREYEVLIRAFFLERDRAYDLKVGVVRE